MVNASAPVCKYILWHWLNTTTGEKRPFACGSWHCLAHRRQLAWFWATRVAAEGPERMVTITSIPKDRREAYFAFQQLIQAIRRKGWAFEYVRFFEVSPRGAYHFHLGQKGRFIPQRVLSSLASANGLGRIVDIRKCFGAGPGWYMSKYIAKGLDELPAGWRKVSASRRFFTGEKPEPTPPTAWVLVKAPL